MNATLTPPAAAAAQPTAAASSLTNLGELILRTSRLTSRGVGVSQILEQAPINGDTEERITVLVMLRAMFWWALRSGHAPIGIKNTRRDLERTIRFIDRRLTQLAELARPGSAKHLPLSAIAPMATDPFGAEIDVREGPALLRVLSNEQRQRHDVAAAIAYILGDEYLPAMSVTVNLPAGWQPSEQALYGLCQAIHTTHVTNWFPGCEPPR